MLKKNFEEIKEIDKRDKKGIKNNLNGWRLKTNVKIRDFVIQTRDSNKSRKSGNKEN